MNVPPDTAPEQRNDAARVGGDDEPAPAPATPAAPVPPAPLLAAPVLAAPVLPAQSREDTDVGWGEYRDRDDDDRLLRDRPPHWDNG
jgi:hypothetical protein